MFDDEDPLNYSALETYDFHAFLSALLIHILHCITHSMPSHKTSVGKYRKNIGCSIALNLFYVCHDATQSSAGAVKSNDSAFFDRSTSSTGWRVTTEKVLRTVELEISLNLPKVLGSRKKSGDVWV